MLMVTNSKTSFKMSLFMSWVEMYEATLEIGIALANIAGTHEQ